MAINTLKDGLSDIFRSAGAYANDLVHPTVRLGVTGLSRAGKTVFITSLIHNIIAGGRLPFFKPVAMGKVKRAYLEPQPDDLVPRFRYEDHLAQLLDQRPQWPSGTSQISQLRLTLEYESDSFVKRSIGHRKLHVDIVDYPGEWLLDLPLLNMNFRTWSQKALADSRQKGRFVLSQAWRDFIESTDVLEAEREQLETEQLAITGAKLFTDYLLECRQDEHAFSSLPPGRFIMPGDLKGSPALTFCPLEIPTEGKAPAGSLWSMMERRYEAYKTHVIKPFFREHFIRLDRQIVLVDTMMALNAGPEAILDLQDALTEILRCFRPGANSWLSAVLSRKIERILFAATKADHLHHSNHDRLENILRYITSDAIDRAEFAGADVEVLAIAAVRATKEAEKKVGEETFRYILGTPLKGERIGDDVFDGTKQVGIFPGDLPEDPVEIFSLASKQQSGQTEGDEELLRFARFGPPKIGRNAMGHADPIPYIRLDRAINFLIGDRLE